MLLVLRSGHCSLRSTVLEGLLLSGPKHGDPLVFFLPLGLTEWSPQASHHPGLGTGVAGGSMDVVCAQSEKSQRHIFGFLHLSTGVEMQGNQDLAAYVIPP